MLAVLGDPALAEDVSQRTFEWAWRRASSFDSARGSVGAWLTTIAHDLAVDAVRARRPIPTDPTDLTCLLGPDTDDPEWPAIRAATLSQLRAAICLLPRQQARAVLLAGTYRMTAREMAEAEGIPWARPRPGSRTP